MHPIADATLVGLRALVRALPVAARVTPQGGQGGRQVRRFGAGERSAKLGQGQGGPPVNVASILTND